MKIPRREHSNHLRLPYIWEEEGTIVEDDVIIRDAIVTLFLIPCPFSWKKDQEYRWKM